MFQLHGDSKYVDVLEKILYNGLISGIGLDGKSFFYTNAMQVKNTFSHKDLERERAGWFDCSCCPTNVTRLLPSVPGYVYAQKDDKVYVNLFINSQSSLMVPGGAVDIIQQNNYPWDGDLNFVVNPKKTTTFSLLVRIPGWSQNQAIPSDLYAFKTNTAGKIQIKINGAPVDYVMEKGYAVLNRAWKKNDKVEVNLPMDVMRVVANKNLKDDIGKVAIQRGPLLYCAEWPENNGKATNIVLPAGSTFTSEYKPNLLNGIMMLKADGITVQTSDDKITTEKKPIYVIPYYAWANRGIGEMELWFPEKIKDVDIIAN
jgi:hypothetical protein